MHIPNDFIEKHWSTLSLSAQSVYVVLQMHGDPCWPSIVRLASITGTTRDTVIRGIRELERAGVVTVIRSRGHSSRYHMTSLPEVPGNCPRVEKSDPFTEMPPQSAIRVVEKSDHLTEMPSQSAIRVVEKSDHPLSAFSQLEDLGISRDILSRYPEKRLAVVLRGMRAKVAGVRDPAAWIVMALHKGYMFPEEITRPASSPGQTPPAAPTYTDDAAHLAAFEEASSDVDWFESAVKRAEARVPTELGETATLKVVRWLVADEWMKQKEKTDAS